VTIVPGSPQVESPDQAVILNVGGSWSDGVMEATERLAEVLEQITELERSIRAAQAEQLRWVHELREAMRDVEAHPARTDRDNREWADRACSTELATALRVHERTAVRHVHDATALAVRLPSTAEAFGAGEVSLQHVRDLIDAVGLFADGRIGEFEREALEKAREMTPVAFRRALRRMEHRYQPTAPSLRKQRALEQRRLVVELAHDGMAWVNLFCAAEEAVAIRARIGAMVGVRERKDPRTRAQRDADAAVSLLLGRTEPEAAPGPGDLGAVRATVHFTIPALTLLGDGEQSATLDEVGPIDIETARRIASHVPSIRSILTDPVTGAMLRYGRKSRRVPADLAGWLRIRDGRCRFPGCEKPAAGSDIDHTVAFDDDGCTDHDNLAHLCRHHHRVKHNTGWRMWQHADGVIRWRSPSGRWHDTRPEQQARAG
jgi:hypothetical protein